MTPLTNRSRLKPAALLSRKLKLLASSAIVLLFAGGLTGCGATGEVDIPDQGDGANQDGTASHDDAANQDDATNQDDASNGSQADQGATEAPRKILILLSEDARHIDLIDTLRARIEQSGGRVRSVLGLAGIVAEMDAGAQASLVGIRGVAGMHAAATTAPAGSSAETLVAVATWNRLLAPPAPQPLIAAPQLRLNDVVIPDAPTDPAKRAAKDAEYREHRAARRLPSRLTRTAAGRCGENGNSYYVTSPFMAGSVAVSVYFQNGTAGGWTPSMTSQTFSDVVSAIDLFPTIQPNANLSFTYVNEVDAGGNPLPVPSNMYLRANEIRDTWCTDWAFVIVVANGGVTPSAWLNGPNLYTDITYGWFADVLRHEVGHIFGAGDAYDPWSPNAFYGHARATHGNACGDNDTGYFPHFQTGSPGAGECLDDLMAGWGAILGYNSRVGTFTAGQLGWYDSSGDGLLDVAETKPVVDAASVAHEVNPDRSVLVTGAVFERPVLGATGDKSINRIRGVQYRVNNSGWQDADPMDGAFESVREGFQLTTPPLKNGNYAIHLRATNSAGKITPIPHVRGVTVSGSSVTNTRPFGALTVTPDRAKFGTTVTASATGSGDLDGGTLQYSWNWGDSGTWSAYTTTTSATHVYSTPNQYTVQVRVRDSGFLIHTVARSIEVTAANTAPIISFKVTPENRHFSTTSGYNITLDVNGSRDGETAASAIQVQWDPTDSGVWSAWSTTKSTTRTLVGINHPKSDWRRVRARIKDAAGTITEASRFVWVVPYNTAPTMNATTGVTFVASGPTDYIATAHATDPNFTTTWDGTLEYRADFENDGIWDTTFSPYPDFAVPAANVSTVLIETRDRFLGRSWWQGGFPNCTTRPTFMTSWWPFDNGTLDDIAGTINSGTATNWPTEDRGAVAEAMCFDGMNDLVTVANHSDNDVAGDCSSGLEHLSVDAWVKTTAGGVQVLLDKRQFASNYIQGWELFVFNGRLGFQMATGAGNSSCGSAGSACTNFIAPTTSPLINDGRWHLIAVSLQRCTSNGGTMYVDGNLVHTFTPRNGPLTNSVGLVIGGSYSSSGIPSSSFTGCLDEVEIFNRAIGLSTVQSIFNAGPAGKCK